MRNDGHDLNERKRMILKAIVESHVKCGEPVGSKALTESGKIPFSPATVRNEMAELEALGYLEQPHTSAGRVPSENGYRFYVNSLMQSYRMSVMEMKRINDAMNGRIAELDKLIEHATKAVSSLTNYTALSVKPKQSVLISRFKTVYLAEGTFLLVMLTNVGITRTKQIRVDFHIDEEMLKRLEDALNETIANVPPESITLPLMIRMGRMCPECENLINPIVKCIYDIVNDIDGGDLRVEGANLLLQYPEFFDTEKFKGVLGMLENKEDILNIVSKSDDSSLHVYIGSESSVDTMKDSSLVFKTIKVGGKAVGAIGVIGPRRMDYSKVMATVDYLAESIEEIAAREAIPGLPPKPDKNTP